MIHWYVIVVRSGINSKFLGAPPHCLLIIITLLRSWSLLAYWLRGLFRQNVAIFNPVGFSINLRLQKWSCTGRVLVRIYRCFDKSRYWFFLLSLSRLHIVFFCSINKTYLVIWRYLTNFNPRKPKHIQNIKPREDVRTFILEVIGENSALSLFNLVCCGIPLIQRCRERWWKQLCARKFDVQTKRSELFFDYNIAVYRKTSIGSFKYTANFVFEQFRYWKCFEENIIENENLLPITKKNYPLMVSENFQGLLPKRPTSYLDDS